MAAAKEYTDEQLNYYRISSVITDILTKGLRTIFKQEWDSRYRMTFGEWKDDPGNGKDFYNAESPPNQRRNKHLLATMIKGNRADWDCTMLFYAILYSDCISGLNAVVKTNVDNLRKFRNEEFAHMPQGQLSELEFNTAIGKVFAAFQALGLSTTEVQQIANQKTFPTKELRDVLDKVNDLKKDLQEKEKENMEIEDQRQVLYEQLLNDTSPFCILPPKPSHDLASRDVEVADITKQLHELKRADESNLSILYISGNPGSGKSQLAGLVAKRFYEKARKDSCSEVFVMTLDAETLDSLLESYITFARQMKCPEHAITNIHSSEDLKTEEKINSLMSLISTKIGLYESWLLLADNVKSLSELHVHLPRQGHGQWGKGYLLITTQDTSCVPLPGLSIQHISASEGMQSQEASSLLALISGISESELGEVVARELDYQPLALASAATYVRQLRQSKRFSEFGWNDFLKKVEKGQRDATETLLAEINPCYKKSMTTATTLAVKEVMESDKIIDHALTFLSVCSSRPLNEDIVVNYIVNAAAIKDKEMIIMKLQRCSLLLSHEDKFGVHIRVHQVVHDVVRSLIYGYPESRHVKTFKSAVAAFNLFINNNLPKESSDSILQSYALSLHLRCFILNFENVLSKVALSGIVLPEMEKLGEICVNQCHFQAAKKYYEFSLQAALIKFGTESGDVSFDYINFGVVIMKLGDFEKAKEYFELALSIEGKKLGPDHVTMATIFNNLGSVHKHLGNFKKAKKYHELALSIRKKKLGPEHVSVATCYNNLGIVQKRLGDFEKAKESYELALSIQQKKLGPDHASVSTSYNNLGSLHKELGDFEKAKKYHELALSICKKNLGPEHVLVETSYNNLGSVHQHLGDFEKAKKSYELALSIVEKKLEPDHVSVSTIYNNLGSVHENLGDFEKAKKYHELALSIQETKLGPEHVSVATSYNTLGSLHKRLGDFEKAKKYPELALSICKKKLGAEHVLVATSYNNLGSVHQDLGDFEKAKKSYELALSIQETKLGPEHVSVATSYDNQGSLHKRLGDFEKAKKSYELALSIRKKKLGPEHVSVATSYNNLGIVHKRLGDFEKAKEYHELALSIEEKKLGREHVTVAISYNNLGSVHKTLGDFEKAKKYHELALSIKEKKLGREQVVVATSYSNLGSVHEELGDFEKAKEYHELARTIRQKELGPKRVEAACFPATKSSGVSVDPALDILEETDEYPDRALNFHFRKRAAEDGLAPVSIDGLCQTSFESGVTSTKKRKIKKE